MRSWVGDHAPEDLKTDIPSCPQKQQEMGVLNKVIGEYAQSNIFMSIFSGPKCGFGSFKCMPLSYDGPTEESNSETAWIRYMTNVASAKPTRSSWARATLASALNEVNGSPSPVDASYPWKHGHWRTIRMSNCIALPAVNK